MSYWRFAAMIVTSTIVMFGLMYLNTYLVTHVFFSETRAYMAVLMGAVMAVIMLAFMLSMYRSRRLNAAIFAGAIVVFAAMLWLVRGQATVGDLSYMRAMIPHHSIAIMTSSRASLSDPRVAALAEGIAEAQNKEIAEMRYLIDDISANGDAAEPPADAEPALVSVDEALASPVIARLDAELLSGADIATLLPAGAACTFAYTTDSAPVLAVGEAEGARTALIKISDDLVAVPASGEGSFAAPGITLTLTGEGGEGAAPATMRLSLDAGLEAGYAGYLSCDG